MIAMTESPASTLTTSVLVVGAGPIGLLCAYQLAKFGIDVTIIDRENKSTQPIYGRACTIWPRTLETWDQLGLLEDIMAEGVATTTGYNFIDGKQAPGGVQFGHRMDRHGDTSMNFAFHLRQRLIEQKIEYRCEELGVKILYEHELESLTDLTGEEEEGMRVTVLDLKQGERVEIQSQYIIGCDGGKSKVRKLAGISFEGTSSGAKWVRMDATVKTDMPFPRGLNSCLHPTHGVVLWCPIDNGRTRIGYVFGEALREKYGEDGLTKEVAMQEAKIAMKPFELEFEEVDWFTLYGIGQRIAGDFVKGGVILAGDSCHTHSSGSAQGLNTGSNDSVNLCWKLSLILRKVAHPSLLDTYNTERKASVQQVIDNDVIISTLISGHKPESMKDRRESPRELLTEWFKNEAQQKFTLGLGIAYTPQNLINHPSENAPVCSIIPGERGPDAFVSRTATNERLRLQRILSSNGKFQILVFAGRGTNGNLLPLRQYLDDPSSDLHRYGKGGRAPWTFTTLIYGHAMGAVEILKHNPFGHAFFDTDGSAHIRYGIDESRGAVLIFRPDGYLGTVVDPKRPGDIANYMGRFLISASSKTNGYH